MTSRAAGDSCFTKEIAMFDRLVLACLGVFLLLFGLFSVTNFEVVWGKPIMGFAALVAGVICCIRAAYGAGLRTA
jgi:hypothetical protein